MKRVLGAVGAALVMVAMPLLGESAGVKALASVRALAIPMKEGEAAAYLQNICSVSSSDEGRHFWLTAAHCVEEDGLNYYIDGDKVDVVKADEVNDVAILHTARISAPALKLATVAPSYAEPAMVIGYPLGADDVQVTVGVVSNPVSRIPGAELHQLFMMLQVLGAPGSSGSAVLNGRGEVISIVQRGPGGGYSPVMAGVVFATLEQFRPYFEQQ